MTSLRFYLALAAVLSFLAAGWYISHLRNDLKNMEAERDKYKVSAETVQNYVRSYEQAKQDNDRQYEKLSSMVSDVPDNPKCPAPASFRKLIDSL